MYLVRKGANPNYAGRHNDGLVLLHYIAAIGDIDDVRELVEEYDAHVRVYDEDGKTPFVYAMESKHDDVMEYLRKRDPFYERYPNKFKLLAVCCCVLFCVSMIIGILLLENVIGSRNNVQLSMGIVLVIIGCISICISCFAIYVEYPVVNIFYQDNCDQLDGIKVS